MVLALATACYYAGEGLLAGGDAGAPPATMPLMLAALLVLEAVNATLVLLLLAHLRRHPLGRIEGDASNGSLFF